MNNKLYGKVVNYIKREYKFLIGCLLIILIGVVKLPVNLYVGGGIIDLEDRVSIENEYNEKGSFNLAYVKEVRATLPTYLLSFLFNWERESIKNIQIDENDNAKDIWKRERLYLEEANDNAVINAYRLAEEPLTITNEVYKVLYIDSDADTNLEIGDEIISVNNKVIKEQSDLKNALIDTSVNEETIIKVMRNNKEKTCYAKVILMNNEKKMGVYLIKNYDYETDRDIEFNFSSREGGSSGGFMLSLAIYNRLVEKDITNGLKIVGTGTIDNLGNVGEIGGVKYKLMGAVNGKADLLFVPYENYQEAIDFKKEKGYNIEIVKVKTLQDAINYLESR